MADYDRRPLPPRRMSSRGGGGGGGLRRNYSSSADEEEYSYYDDEEEEYDDDYYDDEDDDYDDDRQYNRRRSSEDDRYNNSGRSNNNRYSKHHSFHDSGDFKNYHRGGGGGGGRGRELVEYDDRRGGRNNHHHNRSNSRNTQHRGGGGGGQLTSILPAGTPKQAQDIIRRYTLGMPLQNPIHMALPPTTPPEGPAREIATLQVANLNPQEYAFVRRSNGQWTFAQVAVRHDSLGQLVFIVNKMGSTKSFKRHEWPGFVRRIKWTERRVQLPPKPALLEDEIPNVNSLEVQDGGSPEQLALENGPNKPFPAVAPNATIKPPSIPGKQQQQQHLPEVSTMSLKEMKIELQSHGIDFSCFMEKQEFRNAVIDARAEAVKNALIREQQLLQRQQQQARQQQQEEEQNHQQRHNYGYDNPNEINLNSTLDADLSNLAGQTITLQPMQDDEVSELMGDYLLTEYKWQMKVLERERLKKQAGANKMASINEHGGGGGGRDNGDGQQSSAYQSFNIESGEGEKSQPHYEKQAFAKSQKWGSISEDV